MRNHQRALRRSGDPAANLPSMGHFSLDQYHRGERIKARSLARSLVGLELGEAFRHHDAIPIPQYDSGRCIFQTPHDARFPLPRMPCAL